MSATHSLSDDPPKEEESRPTTPTPNSAAEVRSQAVAMLKRAASVPRRQESRRPSHNTSSEDRPNVSSIARQSSNAAAGPSHSPSFAASTYHTAEQEEMLSPSPVDRHYDRAIVDFESQGRAAYEMQRSASASSSFQTGPFGGLGAHGSPQAGASLTPDWKGAQSGQLTPGSAAAATLGRNTPSPLPTLGDLRMLQRSNSQMARARAMDKLTGGRDTPDLDAPVGSGGFGGNLQRAGTVGGNRILGVSLNRAMPQAVPAAVALDPFAPATAFAVPRPRLQRSFTVSSSNMGEERRSAVGRRMVERLAERRVAREQQEAEVRQLWEERRAVAEAQRPDSMASEPAPHEAVEDDHDPEESYYHHHHHEEQEELDDGPHVPTFRRHSPTEPHHAAGTAAHLLHPDGALHVPDRSPSRSTTVSGDEAFEYESHLRRSLSGRTARGSDGVSSETETPVVHANPNAYQREPPTLAPSFSQAMAHEEDQAVPEEDEEDWNLEPPRPAFATPTRRIASAGGGGRERAQKANSPGTDSIVSRDGFGSMMFVVDKGGSEAVPNVPSSDMPVGVEEGGGSEWGTPRKQHGTPGQGSARAASPATPGYGEPHGDDLTPPRRRSSTMSWEEVGGEGDREVPSDQRYEKKSGSMSAKIGRTVKTVMRKRSTSRLSRSSSAASQPPSPSKGSLWNRRGSETSAVSGQNPPLTPSMRDTGKHSSAISTMTASDGGHIQFLGEQVSANFPPVAPPNDPRLLSAKLSPFPGIANLEGGQKLFDAQLSAPPLVSQNSDSVVPTQQRSAPAVANDIYSLPLPPSNEDRRGSADSLGKRSWLAKAFGSATSPRSSGGAGGPSRKSSVAEPTTPTRKQSVDGQAASGGQHDAHPSPIPASMPVIANAVPPRMRARPVSPTVSVVPEGSEDGSRFTRYTTHRDWADHDAGTIQEHDHHEDRHLMAAPSNLSQKSADVLMRMDRLLSMSPEDPRRPDVLDDPPRKLLLATQVLQVVNINTAKDRFLFLFNDILVITKPLITSGTAATLDMRFTVKSVVSLDKLQVSGFSDDSARGPERDTLVAEFVQRFAQNPQAACRFLVERNRWKDDLVSLAAVIFKTPELDKSMIGNLLAEQHELARCFLDQFQFANTRIDDALRSFLLAIRLPDIPARAEALLYAFACKWHEADDNNAQYSPDLVYNLVLAIMQLNDAIHGGPFGFAMHNPALRPDVFVSSFRSKDPKGLIPDHTLEDVYDSISHMQLSQALASDQAHLLRAVTIRPERLPTKLTYGQWSELIEITLPGPDPDFSIQLAGEGLEFDISDLDFRRDSTASFRMRGLGLGSKSIIFNRMGPNAALYAGLRNACVVNIERQFMKNTFHVAFANHLGVKRKYCFSVTDPGLRVKWGVTLQRQIAVTRQAKSNTPSTTRDQLRRATESVALQVLRDALIPSATESDNATSKAKTDRAGSISIAYQPVIDGEERGLGPLVPSQRGNVPEGIDGMIECQSGKELVLLCRQNSLLPGVLELLQAGLEPAPRRPGMV